MYRDPCKKKQELKVNLSLFWYPSAAAAAAAAAAERHEGRNCINRFVCKAAHSLSNLTCKRSCCYQFQWWFVIVGCIVEDFHAVQPKH